MSKETTNTNLQPHALHVGSLLRPKDLLAKRAAFHGGQCSAEELRKLEDQYIADVVKLQKDIGLGIITDGEYHRDVYLHGIFESLEGMVPIPKRSIYEFMPHVPWVQIFSAMGVKEWPSVYCNGKIRRTKPVFAQDFITLKKCVAPEEVPLLKVTMCPPTWHHANHGSEFAYDHSVYRSDEEYFADLVQAFREEILELYELGCRRVQFDDPVFSFFCSKAMIDAMEATGVDHEKLLRTYIDVYNAITADRPADLEIAVHTCRGNMKGMHFAEGGYDRVAEKLFCELDVDVFYLEYDTDRAGGLEPLRYLPPGKRAVLGLVTTKSGELESMEAVKARVARAAEIVADGEVKRPLEDALNQLSISPQCGFASMAEGNPITEEEQNKKLALLVEAARQIWG
ncbi:UROD/MetE-like protein [Trametes coccinea BRFM310]|uniref:UROD/MetE-like protein n=1 Tax=Trametes coccinea (strain BRFM310) TaxID=1353009 RepID=A0A1Y2IPZ7_TRAC3|nr:UROD/MetE-like protein [Trametes coccinea BRFM310]